MPGRDYVLASWTLWLGCRTGVAEKLWRVLGLVLCLIHLLQSRTGVASMVRSSTRHLPAVSLFCFGKGLRSFGMLKVIGRVKSDVMWCVARAAQSI